MRKNFVCAAVATMILTMGMAQADTARVYDNGPVWDISYVQTKPGHFDDYMKYVSTTWKAIGEAGKAKGWVLDYKVLTPADPRDGEADVILMVEYKNMAVFDVSMDEYDAVTKKVFGSIDASTAALMNRESVRTLKGDMLTRELILK